MRRLRVTKDLNHGIEKKRSAWSSTKYRVAKRIETPDSPETGPYTPDKGSDIQSRTPDTPGIGPNTSELGSDVRSGVPDTSGIGPETLKLLHIVMARLI